MQPAEVAGVGQQPAGQFLKVHHGLYQWTISSQLISVDSPHTETRSSSSVTLSRPSSSKKK